MKSNVIDIVVASSEREDVCSGYLRAAAKIVETVAFEVAEHVQVSKVQELLTLAVSIEVAATDLDT